MDLIWWGVGAVVALVVLAKARKQPAEPPQEAHPEIVGLPSRRIQRGENPAPGAVCSQSPGVKTPPASQARPPTNPVKPAPIPWTPPQPLQQSKAPAQPPPPSKASTSRVKLFTYPMDRTAFPPLPAPLDRGAAPDVPPRAVLKGIRWVSRGIVEVGGLTIADPLAYVGTPVVPPHNAVIDPALPVGRAQPFGTAPELPYWPSYCGMSPEARATFLAWLADGRKAPEIQIGYVFVYLYGLEWRALAERAAADLPAIAAEVRRLLDIYGGAYSFRGYANALLDAVLFLQGEAFPLGDEPPAAGDHMAPLSVRGAVGRCVADGRPVPFDLMFLWYLHHETTGLRTAAKRAFPEFRDLCRTRYAAKHGEGLPVKPPKGVLTEEFRAASGNFVVTLKSDLPNVARLTAPIKKMAEIAEAATNDLDKYSRLLGRKPEARGTLEAAALLPADIRDAYLGHEAADLRHRMLGAAPQGSVLCPLAEVAAALGIALPEGGRLRKDVAQSVAAALEAVGCGVEPDVRCGGRPPAVGEDVVLFDLPDGYGGQEGLYGVAYKSAVAILTVAAAVVHADAEVSEAEEAHLTGLIEEFLHLAEAERRRLEAHVRRLLATKADLAAARAAIKSAPEEDRRRMARFALAAASADGIVAPGEVRMLEKLYKELGLDPDDLYGHLHASGGPSRDEPVVVREADGQERLHAIPAPPTRKQAAAQGVALDHEFLDRVRHETRQVSSLLHDIFAEDEQQLPAPPVEEAGGDDRFAGLDAAHAALLAALVAEEGWSREDFEARCAAHRLLPDGAIETINEWSFDTFDEPLLDEDDDITVNLALLGDATPVPA